MKVKLDWLDWHLYICSKWILKKLLDLSYHAILITWSRFYFIIENGEYLGLDLGGTNFRVVRVVMKDGEATTTTKYYNLDDKILSGPCQHVSHLCYLSTFTVESSLFTGGSMSMAFMGNPCPRIYIPTNVNTIACLIFIQTILNLLPMKLHHHKSGKFCNPLTLTTTSKYDYDSSVNLCIMYMYIL